MQKPQFFYSHQLKLILGNYDYPLQGENDEYLINVPQDVMIFNFSAPINENASMWITSGGGIIYAYKNESDTLLFFTAGTDYKMIDKTYRRCGIPDQMVQGGNIISMTKPGDYDASLPYSRP